MKRLQRDFGFRGEAGSGQVAMKALFLVSAFFDLPNASFDRSCVGFCQRKRETHTPLDISPGADRLPALPGHQDLPILPHRHGLAQAERVFLWRAASAGRRSA